MFTKEFYIGLFKEKIQVRPLFKRIRDKILSLNEKEGMSQEELNNKLYLHKQYESFEGSKSEGLGMKTERAMVNMQTREAAEALRRHQEGLTIMTRDEYRVTVEKEEH